MREILLGKSLDELTDFALDVGLPKFAGKQLAQWIYQKEASSFSEMTNLSKAARIRLAELANIGRAEAVEVSFSSDGTSKYLFAVSANRTVETALIPDGDRRTICVSCQVGCLMGCAFCATGKQRWGGNLSAAHILNQFLTIHAQNPVTNVVFMGMGEPMDNIEEVLTTLKVLTAPWGMGMSPRRITVSTVGVNPGLTRFIEESECHLAISLHSPFDQERSRLVPANQRLPLDRLLSLLKRYSWYGQRKLSFEYVVLAGENDTPDHVHRLAALLKGIPCLVNLIGYHPHPGSSFDAPSNSRLHAMRDELNAMEVVATVRASRGMDINAACGLLSKTYQQASV